VEFGAELEPVGKRSTGQVQPVNRSIGITPQTGKKSVKTGEKPATFFENRVSEKIFSDIKWFASTCKRQLT
jgi:hypothetical protein